MKATVWVNKNLSVEVSGESDKELFSQIAKAQALFEDSVCGHCGSENIRFVVRQVEGDNEYYELHCKECGHKLVYGHAKSGYMYPKRYETNKKGIAVKDESGKPKFLPHKGWQKPFVENNVKED